MALRFSLPSLPESTGLGVDGNSRGVAPLLFVTETATPAPTLRPSPPPPLSVPKPPPSGTSRDRASRAYYYGKKTKLPLMNTYLRENLTPYS